MKLEISAEKYCRKAWLSYRFTQTHTICHDASICISVNQTCRASIQKLFMSETWLQACSKDRLGLAYLHTLHLMWSKNLGQSRVNDNWHLWPALHLLFQTKNICQTLMYQRFFNFRFFFSICLSRLLLFRLLGDIIDSRVVKNNCKFAAWIVKRFGDKCGTLPQSQCRRWPACIVFAG